MMTILGIAARVLRPRGADPEHQERLAEATRAIRRELRNLPAHRVDDASRFSGIQRFRLSGFIQGAELNLEELVAVAPFALPALAIDPETLRLVPSEAGKLTNQWRPVGFKEPEAPPPLPKVRLPHVDSAWSADERRAILEVLASARGKVVPLADIGAALRSAVHWGGADWVFVGARHQKLMEGLLQAGIILRRPGARAEVNGALVDEMTLPPKAMGPMPVTKA
ncbi:hypothetical protein ACFQU1_04890 [Chelatococcus sp. GCM10030263]|uniref:hypothetical protein n=1 Tax=Chelatococcus sp. GCM10030263 TaxID=3273387 RepID=UPI00360CB974